jgi:hypothetical protein
MALISTQPPTEINTRNLPGGGGEGQPALKAERTVICEPIFYKMWEPRRLSTFWASMACYRDSFTFYHYSLVPQHKIDKQSVMAAVV